MGNMVSEGIYRKEKYRKPHAIPIPDSYVYGITVQGGGQLYCCVCHNGDARYNVLNIPSTRLSVNAK